MTLPDWFTVGVALAVVGSWVDLRVQVATMGVRLAVVERYVTRRSKELGPARDSQED